ncbi:hypothetical protein A8709_15460 [Paenibacillus pectinilyticus]|uniref:Alpha-L-fucosidase n=1 Tax=Paenibacillus pectinilyticus TaxID=512399 RepID=A0A1C1A4I3_9BACL|nr:hypothetical protein [Paenibacillus pectinilyticus]OCT15472.1 hypothetical protein A8709_15460 [Paenibacillus pectinilyticus]
MSEFETSQVKLDVDWEHFMADQDMEWVVKPTSWEEGAFLGNGLIGAMIYGEEHASKRNVLRWVTGRTDVVVRRTDQPGFPPRVPIGELHLELSGKIYHPTTMRLDIWNAELHATLTTTQGEVKVRTFVHSEDPVIAIELETSEGERDARCAWVAYPEVDHVLKNADGFNLNQYVPSVDVEKLEVNGVHVCRQHYSAEEMCVTAWKEVQIAPNRRVCFLSIAFGQGNADLAEAVDAIIRATSQDFQAWVDTHRTWWHRYYQQSFISIPDGQLESFYWLQMYKLASATRADKPLIDNQGPWLTSTPWPGVWFNMNVQMSYSPIYTANRLELGESLVRALEANVYNLIRNVRQEFQHDSAGLGRSCSYDLVATVDDEVGNLTWICHNLWRHYRYSMDEDMLSDVLFPILRRSIQYYLHILEGDEEGKLHLPATISPEYGSFMRTTVQDCHYDLALLRWGCKTLLHICERHHIEDSHIESWKDVLARLTAFPVDETGFMVGKDTPLAYGHRHFSHLLAIFPLHLIGCEDEADRKLVATSLRHWLEKEGDLRGFSLTGAASIAATLGWGNLALDLLKSLMLLIKPNTMYKEAGPVMETPLAGAEAIHDMLLQSWGGMLRVFPAVPDAWDEAVFHDLRGEGAFLVSASRKGGETQFIRVSSLAGEPCRIKTGWKEAIYWRINGDKPREGTADLSTSDGEIQMELAQGEEVILHRRKESLDLGIRAMTRNDKVVRYFGGHKPWRLYGITCR